MDAKLAPSLKVKKGEKSILEVGGEGGGIEATATIYYVSDCPHQYIEGEALDAFR